MKLTISILVSFLLFASVVFSQEIIGPKPTPKPPPKVLTGPPSPAKDYNPDSWREFVSLERSFKVKLPAIPQERYVLDEETSDLIGMKYRLGYENFIVYSIEALNTSYSEEFLKDEKLVFSSFAEKRRKKFEQPAKIISQLSSMKSGCPANYVEYDAGKDLRYRALYVFCSDWFYVVSIRTIKHNGGSAMGSKGAYEEIAKSFIGSFEVLEPEDLKRLKSTANAFKGKFSDEEYRFSIEFPGEPEIVEDVYAEQTSQVTYSAESDEFIYKVVAKSITDQFSFSDALRNKFYDEWRNGFLEGSNGKLVSESDFIFKSIKGRKFAVKVKDLENPMLVRLLALNGKLYAIFFTDTKESGTPERAAAAIQRSEKFFASFEKLFEAFPPKYYGLLYRDVYTSEFYGVSINVPQKWTLSGGQVLATFDEDRDDIVFDVENLNSREPSLLLLWNGHDEIGKRALIKLDARFLPLAGVSLNSVADVVTKLAENKESNMVLAEKFAKTDINGNEVWKATYASKDPDQTRVFLKSYFFRRGNYLLILNCGYSRDEDKILIEEAVKSLRVLQ